MELSARIFGVNSWSILAPQALEGVATVGAALRHRPALVRRRRRGSSPARCWRSRRSPRSCSGSTTPTRCSCCCSLGATYATVRAIEDGRTALAGARRVAGRVRLPRPRCCRRSWSCPPSRSSTCSPARRRCGRRIGQLAWAGRGHGRVVGLVGRRGRAAPRPRPALHRRLAGQQHPQPHLRLQRLRPAHRQRDRAASVAAAPTGSMWGADRAGTGCSTPSSAARSRGSSRPPLILLVVVLWPGRQRRRTDRTRAAFLLWGGILLVTGLIFSFAAGIIHPYYTVALAPAIGALVGMGAVTLWRRRDDVASRIGLVAAITATAAWAAVLLDRSPTWMPWLRTGVLVLGLGAALVVAVTPRAARPPRRGHRDRRARDRPGGTGGLQPEHGPHRAQRGPAERRAGRFVGGRGGPGGGGFGGQRPTGTGAGGLTAPTGATTGRAGGTGGGGGFLDSSTPGTALVAQLKAGRQRLPLGPGHRELELGGRLPAGHRRPGHGHRGVQRHRPGTHPRRVPGAGEGAPGPLLRRRRRHRATGAPAPRRRRSPPGSRRTSRR